MDYGFYAGNPAIYESEYSTKHKMSAGGYGGTTSIQTANQVKEVTNLLNQGMKVVEVSTISPDVFEMIPKQSLKEINRLTKLTGSETTLHAPIIDPSGFTQQGWDEANRENVENQFKAVILRAHELNPDALIPVTFHASSQIPGTETIEIRDPETGKMKEVTQKMVAVNVDNGQLIPLVREERFYPETIGAKKEYIYTPEKELVIANESYWDNKLSQLVFYKERGDEVLKSNSLLVAGPPEKYNEAQKSALSSLRNVEIYYKNTHQVLNSLFNEAYKCSDEETKKQLMKASQEFKKDLKDVEEVKSVQNAVALYGSQLSFEGQALQNLINAMQKITSSQYNHEHVPQIYKPVEQFVNDKASKTFANVAFEAYKKFGQNAPIVSIENPPYGSAVSTAKDLRELVEKTRNQFVEQAKKSGMDESQARAAAENIIGATWDTSHISMMRKQGFKPERLVEEAKIIAPFVKHVHLNDNFGSSHTDLPPGMGDVPIKEVMEQIEKSGFKGKKVFEGGNFFQHFQASPYPYTLMAFGSPLYSTGAGPNWDEAYQRPGSYFSGQGVIFPERYFSEQGGGFSGLPSELGGQIQSRASRMTGTPMA